MRQFGFDQIAPDNLTRASLHGIDGKGGSAGNQRHQHDQHGKAGAQTRADGELA